ncbi:hypothetical protein B5G26_09440 [Anaerotignum lactatifermentans]|uniref:Uncharacterized protein n=1 Tax=Anaerotignum lactatifermentans TaxID=160404 RepID=A0A1Y3U506_9FIRM|nr:hypothetical protein [Anaerotignum lactatifermentans]OUN42187.1 hypothetical protein B5G26_09440 [Anaerotignum lactatifermentans]
MKIDFISDGSRQKNPSTAPAAEKDSRLAKPLKSGKMWIFQRCKNGKVTVVTVFGWAGKKLTLLTLSERRNAFVGDVTACVAMRNRIGGCDHQRNKRAT